MITAPGSFKTIFEITDTDIKIPERVDKKFIAPSSSVLAIVCKDHTKLIVGRHAGLRELQNTLGFAIKNRKHLRIEKCEVLSNLQDVDRMVVLCNELIDDLPPIIEEDDVN